MLVFVFFGLVCVLLGLYLWDKSPFFKDRFPSFRKLASGVLFLFGVILLYTAFHYIDIGDSITRYYNNGDGISYTYLDSLNQTITNTVFDQSDIRVGEYFAIQQADRAVMDVIYPLFPVLIVLIVIYSIWTAISGFWSKRG